MKFSFLLRFHRHFRILFSIILIGGLLSQSLLSVSAAVGDISTFAGGGHRDGGLASQALINMPVGMAYDSQGNLFVSDSNGHRIRKVDKSNGIISTIAGTGYAGFEGDGGPALQARMNVPYDIAFDSQDNLYLIDLFSRRIRRIDANTGIISTIAGTGNLTPSTSCSGSLAVNENLFNPTGIAIDANDDILVGIQNGNRVCRIDKDTNVITLVAGTGGFGSGGDGGPATSATFRSVQDVEVDGLGNIYVSELNGHRIRKIDAGTGIISTVVGTGVQGFSGDGGAATSAQIANPGFMSFDSVHNLYFADTSNHRVRKLEIASGIITTVVGVGTQGFSGDGASPGLAELNGIRSVLVDGNDDLYLSDSGNHRVRFVDIGADLISTYAGSGNGDGSTADNILVSSVLMGMTSDSSGNIYFSEGTKVRKIDSSSRLVSPFAGTGVSANNGDGGPALDADLIARDIIFDSEENMYLADSSFHVVRKIDALTGIISTIAGTGVSGFSGDGAASISAQLSFPFGLAFDVSGDLYIADGFNHRIRKIDMNTGIISTIAGTGVPGFSGDGGPATSAQFFFPSNIAIDDQENLYITDQINNRIRLVDLSSGIVSTYAGTGTAGFSGDNGPALNAQLNRPAYIDVDENGNIFFSDQQNQRVRTVDQQTGLISTLAGIGSDPLSPIAGASSGDGGPANQAELNFPHGLTFDEKGDFYILESYRLRKVQLVAEAGRRRRSFCGNASVEFSD